MTTPLTEADWLASCRPQPMLDQWWDGMHRQWWQDATDDRDAPRAPRRVVPSARRRLKLLGTALCRAAWGHCSAAARTLVWHAEDHPEDPLPHNDPALREAVRVAGMSEEQVGKAARRSADAAHVLHRDAKNRILAATRRLGVHPNVQADLLREVLGNPFRPTEGHEAVWRNPQTLALAHAAYDERTTPCVRCGGTGSARDDAGTAGDCPLCGGSGRFTVGTLDPVRLAVLSDALEESGCDDVRLLGHLRGLHECPDCVSMAGLCGADGNAHRCTPACPRWLPGHAPHVLGCWAVDAVLGK